MTEKEKILTAHPYFREKEEEQQHTCLYDGKKKKFITSYLL